MINRVFILSLLIIQSLFLRAQCECGEDAQGPALSLDPQIIWSTCDTISFPPIPQAIDDCTPEPTVSLFTDTISDFYCGIAPVFNYQCNHSLPFNLSFNSALNTWAPYTNEQLGIRTFDDGTVKIYGKIRSVSNAQVAFTIELNFLPAMDWTTHSTNQEGNSYYSGCLSVGQPFDQWQYLQLNPGTSFIFGNDAMAGTLLQVSASTLEPWRAFQIGEGASGVVSDNSISGAFQCDGDIIFNGQLTATLSNAPGELVGIISCCASPYIKATYTTTDLCENSRVYMQVVEVRDNFVPIGITTTNSNLQFCDSDLGNMIDWLDGCTNTNTYVFTTPIMAWTMGMDLCGNYAISPLELNLQYPVGDACSYFGCTDPNAPEYNPQALFDDNSCFSASVRVKMFIDANSNGSFDPGESTYSGPWVKNTSMPEALLSINGEDTYVPYDYTQETITIELQTDGLNGLTSTTPISQSFLNSDPPSALFFGLMYDSLPEPSIEISMFPEHSICLGTSLEFTLQIANNSPYELESGQVEIILPEHVNLISADNLLTSDSIGFSLSYDDLNIGEFANFKINLEPISDSLVNAEFLLFRLITRDIVDTLFFNFPIDCASNQMQELSFWASPLGFGEENFISPIPILYNGIFTNTTESLIQELDLTIFPDINTAPFDIETFAATYPFTASRSENPLRYNIHFDNLELNQNNVLNFAYQLDASNILSETIVQQQVYYSVDDNFVQVTNNEMRTVVVCSDFLLSYDDNQDQCIDELILSTTSNFYTDFRWVNSDTIYYGDMLTLDVDSVISPGFTLIGTNSVCYNEMSFEIGELHSPRVLFIAQSDTSFCAGDILTITPVTNLTALEWYEGSNLIALDSQLDIVNATTLTIVAPESGPCPAIEESLVLTRIEPVTALLEYQGDSLICLGESLEVTATGTNGQTTLYVNDIALNELTYLATEATNIEVITTNVCFTEHDSLITLSGFFPEISFILNGETSFCEGEVLNVSIDGSGDLSLLVNGNTMSTWPINIFASSTVAATATNECGSVTDNFDVVVYPGPSDEFIYDQNTQTITAVDQGTYQWLLFGNPIVGATSQSYTITETGAYALQIVSENGCENTSSTQFINYIAVEEQPSSEVKVFPNPAQDMIYIQGLESFIGKELIVFNSLGQRIHSLSNIASNRLRLDLTAYPKGIYHLQIGTLSRSFIVE